MLAKKTNNTGKLGFSMSLDPFICQKAFHFLSQVHGRSITVARLFTHGLETNGLYSLRTLGLNRPWMRPFLLDDECFETLNISIKSLRWTLPTADTIEDRSQTVDIARCMEGNRPRSLFRAHVGRRAGARRACRQA